MLLSESDALDPAIRVLHMCHMGRKLAQVRPVLYIDQLPTLAQVFVKGLPAALVFRRGRYIGRWRHRFNLVPLFC
jgi:hypothetical protein